jgi:succinate dehydrogenase / fumarate reductase, cytochrome b subunit
MGAVGAASPADEELMKPSLMGADAVVPARPMERHWTTAARKALVATSGLLMWGWCYLHLLGNLTAFAGSDAMDAYAALLRRGRGWPLWSLRLLLGTALLGHVLLAAGLFVRARRARPVRYAVTGHQTASRASRSMRWSGILLLSFIIFHVLHLTVGALHPDFKPGQVYANLVRGLGSGLVVIWYVLAAAALGLHLSHGVCAAPVSLGWRVPQRTLARVAAVLGLVLGLGFASVPVAIALGVLS